MKENIIKFAGIIMGFVIQAYIYSVIFFMIYFTYFNIKQNPDMGIFSIKWLFPILKAIVWPFYL